MSDAWGWSDGHVELIKKLWAEGMSASVIANEVGRSRNAVLGKLHRLGLSGRVKVGHKPEPKRKAPRVPPAAPRRIAPIFPSPALAHAPEPIVLPEPDLVVVEEHDAVGLMGLKEYHCRAPRWGDEKPTPEVARYCGARVRSGESYCAHHCRLFYSPVPVRQRAKDPPPARHLKGEW